MKVKRTYDYEAGTCDEVRTPDDGEQVEVRSLDLSDNEPVEMRQFDLSDEVKPPAMGERRKYLAHFDAQQAQAYLEAFVVYTRHGWRAMTDEQRAQGTVTSGGGYTIKKAFEKDFIAAMKQNDPIIDISTSFETPTGAAGNFPIDDDVLSGRIVAESGAATETDVTYGSLPLVKCPKHGSDIVRVPLEQLDDSFTTYDTLISPVLSRRLARSVAATAVTRLLADADVAVTAASTTAAVPSEIIDLMAAVDPAHSRVGVFLMNEVTLTTLRKFTAYTAGYYPNMISTDLQGRETIFGKPVYSSPPMPALGAGNKPIAFGNFKRNYIRTVAGSLVLQRYDERYAEFAQVGFQMFWRAQAAMAKSTNNPVPVRLLACHS